MTALLSLAVYSGMAQDWKLKTEKDSIRIYSRNAGSKFDDIKVELNLNGTVDQLARILSDVGSYPQWAYGTKSATIIKKINKTEFIYYSVIEVPWPATNRDLYANFKLVHDSVNHSITVTANGISDYGPAKPDLVRILKSTATWTATTLPNKQVHIQYTLQLDPGGNVPAWVLNLFSNKGPMETFSNLKKRMAAGR